MLVLAAALMICNIKVFKTTCLYKTDAFENNREITQIEHNNLSRVFINRIVVLKLLFQNTVLFFVFDDIVEINNPHRVTNNNNIIQRNLCLVDNHGELRNVQYREGAIGKNY